MCDSKQCSLAYLPSWKRAERSVDWFEQIDTDATARVDAPALDRFWGMWWNALFRIEMGVILHIRCMRWVAWVDVRHG
jgi:hypothetical protein